MRSIQRFVAGASRRWRQPSPGYRVLPSSSMDEDVESAKGSGSWAQPRPFFPKILSKLLMKLFLLLLGAFIGLRVYLHVVDAKQAAIQRVLDPTEETTFPDAQGLPKGDRRFVVVVPVDNPSPDLCKLLVSAIALGYPAPILVNWGRHFDDVSGSSWAPYFGKISGTLDFLDQVTRAETAEEDRLGEDDLVLIVDAYDVWFQLPPSVLLQRFHETNIAANARLAREWTRGAPHDHMPMQQTIVVSAQKRCYPTPKSGSNLHCDSMPQSPLPPDVYGSKTDTLSKGNKYHNFRPRFINSGSFMGPVGDMRRYFRRVQERLHAQLAEGRQLPGDQGVFGEILGEQEVWRQWRRDVHRTASPADVANGSHAEAAALAQRDFEFHVGLDYTQNLFLPTVYEEDDGDFVALRNQSGIDARSARLGIAPSRLRGVPKDLADTPNPLAEILPDPSAKDTDWGEMPLYADFFTTAVPAVLHHNAWKDGLKNRRVWWWDRTWFFPHLRSLMQYRLREAPPPGPLARIPVNKDGGGARGYLTYSAPRSAASKRYPRIYAPEKVGQGFDEAEFDAVCRYPNETSESEKHWYDEVFRDGRGLI